MWMTSNGVGSGRGVGQSTREMCESTTELLRVLFGNHNYPQEKTKHQQRVVKPKDRF